MDYSKSPGQIGLLIVAISFLHTCLAFTKALERMKLEGHDNHDIDIYIEKKITFLHSKIDLKTTLDGLLTLEKCAYRLDQGPADSLNRALANNLNKRLSKIAGKITRITGQDHLTTKHKRSIDFIGNLISDLFGNPGPADWKQINSNVLALKGAIQKSNENADIDHADIDKNRHIIEQHNAEIRELVAVLNKNKAELTKIEAELIGLRVYFEISTLADAVETQIDFLIEIKVDSMKGFCNDRALSKEFLIDNLLSLESNKVGLGPVFGSWEWRNYYKQKICTVALDKNTLWVTLRIPIVKKAEKLIRIVPTPKIHEVLTKIAGYAIEATLFKEKDNEKYHVITRSSLDLCNSLGNTKTCGVRDVKFSVNNEVVIPVEFSLNRFLIVSAAPIEIKVMSKCPAGITEHIIGVDSVWLVPNNCSYTSSFLTIDQRESDIEVTKEIGIVHFDNFEVSPVSSHLFNNTKLLVTEILSSNSSKLYERNKIEIANKLDNIETKHESFQSRYLIEKWLIVAGILVLAGAVIFVKIRSMCNKRQLRPRNNDIELQTISTGQVRLAEVISQQDQQQLGQQQQLQQQLTTNDKNNDNRGHVYSEIAAVDNISFSSKPEHSQFYSK